MKRPQGRLLPIESALQVFSMWGERDSATLDLDNGLLRRAAWGRQGSTFVHRSIVRGRHPSGPDRRGAASRRDMSTSSVELVNAVLVRQGALWHPLHPPARRQPDSRRRGEEIEGGQRLVLHEGDGEVSDVDADRIDGPACDAAFDGRYRNHRSGVQHHVAGIAAGLDYALQQALRLLCPGSPSAPCQLLLITTSVQMSCNGLPLRSSNCTT